MLHLAAILLKDGLRDYGIEPQVWGGDPECEHSFGDDLIRGGSAQKQGASSQRANRANVEEQSGQSNSLGAFCVKCGTAWRGSLGLEPTLDLYLDHMVDVFREVRRVLRKDGTCWLNIGDSYASGEIGRHDHKQAAGFSAGSTAAGRSRIGIGMGAREQRRVSTGTKNKDLLLIPSRLAIRLQESGWWVRSDIAWCKRSPMPESCTDRPTAAWEHIFLLTKSAKYFWDQEAVKEDVTGNAHERGLGNNPKRSLGLSNNSRSNETFVANELVSSRNMRNYWILGPEPFPEAHFATFPTEIPRRAILAGTSEKGVCGATVTKLKLRDDLTPMVETKCGAPWARMTGKRLDNVPTRMATKRAPVDCVAVAAYLRESREKRGLSRAAVDAALGTHTLYSWFEGRPAGIEPPTPDQWSKLKDILDLDERFDPQIYGTVEVLITDHSPSKAFGVRTYAKAWDSETETIGWRPTCGCTAAIEGYSCGDCTGRAEDPCRCRPELKPVPATVLDPFLGAGTTALVADQLQRDAIGIELNPKYTELARARIEKDGGMFVKISIENSP